MTDAEEIDNEILRIEEIDKEILRILSQDSRKTHNAIAIELGKSPITIKKHVEELEKNKVIKDYGVNIDFDKLGYNIIAVIELTVSKGKMLEIENQIADNPNVFAVYDITGTYDALILARFKDRSELSGMIKEIHKSPEVERTNTHLILNVIKEQPTSKELI
jgi:Lrp/AsnC family transcriptional regulator for asnA, asnC and gidA